MLIETNLVSGLGFHRVPFKWDIWGHIRIYGV